MSGDHDKDLAGLRPGTASPATMTTDKAAAELASLAEAIAFHDQRYHGDEKEKNFSFYFLFLWPVQSVSQKLSLQGQT